MLRNILWLAVFLVASSGKKCCDEHCRRPISYGRTVQRHIADPQTVGSVHFLSFAQGSLVQVFAKEIVGEEKEYWEAEVSGHRGLVPRASIAEQHVVCHSPQHTLQDPPELAPPPRGTQDDSPAWDGGRPGQEAAQDDVSATEGRDEASAPEEEVQEGGTPEGHQQPAAEDRQEHTTPDRGVQPAGVDQFVNTNAQGGVGQSPPEVTEGSSPSEEGKARDVGSPPPPMPPTPDWSDTGVHRQEPPLHRREDGSADTAGMEDGRVVAEQVVVNGDTVLNTAAGFDWDAGDGIPETISAFGPGQFGGDFGKTIAEERAESSANGASAVEEEEEEKYGEEDGEEEEEEEKYGEEDEEEGEEEEEKGEKDNNGENEQGDDVLADELRQDGGELHQDGGELHQDGGELHQDGGELHQDRDELHQDGGELHQDGGELHQDRDELHQDGGLLHQEGGEDHKDWGKQRPDGGEHSQDGGEDHEDWDKHLPDRGEHHKSGGHEDGIPGVMAWEKDLDHSDLVEREEQTTVEEVLSVMSEDHAPSVGKGEGEGEGEGEGTTPTAPTEADSAVPPVQLTVSGEDKGWDTLATWEDPVQPTDVIVTEWQSDSPSLPQESVTVDHMGDTADDMGDTVDDSFPAQDNNAAHTPANPLQEEDLSPPQVTAPSINNQFNPFHTTPAPLSDNPTSPPSEWEGLGQPTVELRRKTAGDGPLVGGLFHHRRMVQVGEDEREAPLVGQLVDEGSPEPQSLSERLLLYLPHPLRGVLEAQFGPGGMVGMLYGVVGTLLALVVPSCLLCCQSCSSRRKHTRAVQQHKASKQQLQQQLDAATKEKGELNERLKAEQAQCSSVEHQLANVRQTVAGLEHERGSLMDHIGSLTHALTEVKGELQVSQENGSQLAAMLAQEQTRSQSLEAQVASLGQELTAASSSQQRSEGQVAELEAAKDQMEQDLFNSQQALQTLQQSERKLTAKCDTLQHSVQGVSSELQEAQSEVFHLRQAVQDKDMEMEMLRNCLRQLTPEEGEGGEEREGEEEGTAGSEGEAAQLHQSRVEKIHAMLDTSKAQLELKSVKDERDRLDRDLQLERGARLSSEAEVQRLEQELQALSAERDAMTLQHQQTLSKLQTLTEYFESKEQNLHRRLGREEMARQEMEGREASAKELVMAAEEERTREKEELKDLRKQMAEIEKSMTEQVFTNQQRAQEAYSQLKRREQELRVANKEITTLKQSLDEADAQIAALSRPRTPPRFPPFGRPPPPHGRLSVDDFDGHPRPLGPPPPHTRYRPPSVGPVPQDRHPPGVGGVPRPSSTQPRTSSPGGPEEDLSVSHVSAPGSGGPPSRSRSPNSIAGEMPPRNPSGRLSVPEFMDQPPMGPRSGPTYPAGIYRGPPPGVPRGEYPPYALVVRQPIGRGSFPPAPFVPPPRIRGPPPGSYPAPHGAGSPIPDKSASDNFVRALPRQPGPPPLTRPEGMAPSPPRERGLPPPDQTARPPLHDVYPPPDQTGRPPLRNVYPPADQTGRPTLRDVYPPPDQTGRPPLRDVYPPPDQTGRPPLRDVYPPPDQTSRPPLRDVYPPPDQTGRPPLRDGYLPPGSGMLAARPPMGGPPPHLQGSTPGAATEQVIQPRNV